MQRRSNEHYNFGGGVIGDDWRDGELIRITFNGDKVSVIETRE